MGDTETIPTTQQGLRLRYSAVSDLGRVRKDNQDSGYASEHLLIVADGVGGAAYGDVASSTAVHLLRRLENELPIDEAATALAGSVHRVHDRLAEMVEEDDELSGTSTTLTAALFDGQAIDLVHVGDSRAYLLRDGTLSQLTHDHTLVQSLVDEGRITEDEARVHPHRNIILRAVDGVHDAEPDLIRIELQAGDRLMLCSDGCCGAVSDADLARLIGDGTVDRVALGLVNAALEGGTTDNVTVVVAEVVGVDEHDDEETNASIATGPMLVGAAVHQPRRGSKLGRALRRSFGSDAADGSSGSGSSSTGTDPELARYAPRAPQRFLALRRLGWVALLVVALIGLTVGSYQWTRGQYYVASDGDLVAVFRGVQVEVPGIELSQEFETSTLRVTELPEYAQARVEEGITADNLTDARRIVGSLQIIARCDDDPSPASALAEECEEVEAP